MRLVIQRVSEAAVSVDENVVGSIREGLLVLVGIEDRDEEEDTQWLAGKLVQLRIFNDEEHVPNLSVLDAGGDILIISQFTLHAATRKGNRPSYIRASKPEKAIPAYEEFIAKVEGLLGKKVATGVFGADMKVQLINDGPVTILMDSKHRDLF